MGNKQIGLKFFYLSAFFIGVLYISAAIYGSNSSSWGKEYFHNLLSAIGFFPIFLSILSFIIGLVFFLKSDQSNQKGKKKLFVDQKSVEEKLANPFSDENSN